MQQNPAIALRNIAAAYGRRPVLADISAEIAAGTLTAIVGPNGAGKSTLLKLVAGILKPKRGTVNVTLPLAYLPQQSEVQRDFPISALQAAATGLWPALGERGTVTPAMRQRIRAAVHEVGLQGCEERQLSELSGGQFQRLLFARVIVQDAPLILLDEPFAGIDEATIATLLTLIRSWHAEGRTILCVLHDRMLVEQYFPARLALTQDGRLQS